MKPAFREVSLNECCVGKWSGELRVENGVDEGNATLNSLGNSFYFGMGGGCFPFLSKKVYFFFRFEVI